MIDTHVHIWNLARARYAWLDGEDAILNRDYSIEQWDTTANDFVKKGILVQAANNLEDTQVMLDAMETCPRIAGVVGWLPLQKPDEVHVLLTTRFKDDKRLKGIRHLIHNEADTKWLLLPEVLESLQLLAQNNLSYDLVGVEPAHIETAIKVAEKVPGLRLVFDHLNQPPIASGELYGEWGRLMEIAASHPNFYAKISGLGHPSGKPFTWHASDIEPYVAFALQNFGEGRIFCGSDWPVCLLNGTYDYTMRQYMTVLHKLLPPAGIAKITESNASHFYQLQ